MMIESKDHTSFAHSKVYICQGKSCRKNKSKYQKLLTLFPAARETKCMGICKGPVVMIKKGNIKYFFKKIKKKKDRRYLLDFLTKDVLNKKMKYTLK